MVLEAGRPNRCVRHHARGGSHDLAQLGVLVQPSARQVETEAAPAVGTRLARGCAVHSIGSALPWAMWFRRLALGTDGHSRFYCPSGGSVI